jgi:hypothetical protein
MTIHQDPKAWLEGFQAALDGLAATEVPIPPAANWPCPGAAVS